MTITVEPRTNWIPDDSSFGARLALVRQRMGWGNVKEGAEECGVPVQSWRRWERDNRLPRDYVAKVGKISDRTGCNFDWLLRGRREPMVGYAALYQRMMTATRRPPNNRPNGRAPVDPGPGVRRTVKLPRLATA